MLRWAAVVSDREECEWVPSVSELVAVLTRERRKGKTPGGLDGPVSLLGQISAARPFSFVSFFSFSNSIFWNDFDMNSNPF